MKRISHMLVLGSVTMGAFAGNVKVKEMISSDPTPVRRPIMVNEVNNKNEKFDDKKLLSTPVRKNGELKVIKSDSLGVFGFKKPESDFHISQHTFYVESDKFSKAKLQVESNAQLELLIDNKKVNLTAAGKDTITHRTKHSANITLEPAGNKEITIKVLSSSDLKNDAELAVSVTADSTTNVTVSTSAKRSLSIEDLMIGERIAGSNISPNGDFALLTISITNSDGKRAGQTKLFDLTTNSEKSILNGNHNYSWMPESNLLYYTEMIDGSRVIRTLNPSTLEIKTVATDIPEGRFFFSPTEDYLVYSVEDKIEPSKEALQRVITPDDRQPNWKSRYALAIYDIKTGVYQPLTYGFNNSSVQDISNDGKKILFSVSKPTITERPLRRSSYYEVSLETMAIDTIFTDMPYVNSISYSPDEKSFLMYGTGEAFDGLGLDIKKKQISNLYDQQLFIFNRETKKAEAITRKFAPSVERAYWNRVDNNIYVKCEDKDRVQVYRYDVANAEYTKLELGIDAISDMRFASKDARAVFHGCGESSADKMYSYDIASNKITQLYETRAEKMEQLNLGEVKDWSFKSTDGTVIDGRYYLPVDFDPAKKYPMIVYYYGGTSPTARNLFHPYSMHLYAAQGFVVYVVQPSGTTGWGQEFSSRHVNGWGKQAIDDIITGVKQFCKEHTFVNEKKVGCMGASYGGYTTMYLQTQTDIFAAAISHAGISAISSYWGEGYWGYSYSAAASAYSFPWNNQDLYVKRSPLYNADKINTPILLLHGKADTNVPIGESIQMFTALKVLGKQVDFIQVEGENHGIADFTKRIAWKKSIFAYFAKWLKDEPEWWNELYPESHLEN